MSTIGHQAYSGGLGTDSDPVLDSGNNGNNSTLCTWVWQNNYSGISADTQLISRNVVDGTTVKTQSLYVSRTSGSLAYFFASRSSTGGTPATSPSGIPLQTWIHVAVTYDIGTTLDTIFNKIYINGQLVGESSLVRPYHSSVVNVPFEALGVGVRYYGNVAAFTPGGPRFFDARVYREVLSSEVIKEIYNARGQDSYLPQFRSCIADYSSTTIFDATQKRIHDHSRGSRHLREVILPHSTPIHSNLARSAPDPFPYTLPPIGG